MKITIYKNEQNTVEKALDKLKAKANLYNCSFSYVFGESFVKEITAYEGETKSKLNILAVDVDITTDIIIQHGWKVVAYIQHFPTGNVVKSYINTISPEWFKCGSNCDHCNTNRARKETFIVQKQSGEFRQVGSTCLQDYTGINPSLAIQFARLEDFEVHEKIEGNRVCNEWKLYELKEVVALAIKSIEKYGYVKSDNIRSTKNDIIDYMVVNKSFNNSEKDLEEASRIIEFVSNIEVTDNLSANLKSICNNEYCFDRIFGFVAYLPMFYKRTTERLFKKKDNQVDTGEYYGKIGDKFSVEAECKFISSFHNSFDGMTHLYSFTKGNNVFIWFTSKIDVEEGKCKISGTVKDFRTFNGQKQTIVTRCKQVMC